MHPFVHAFTPGDRPAVGGARPTSRLFHLLAAAVLRDGRGPTSASAGTWSACPLQHDTPGETAQPGGASSTGATPGVAGVPGRTMPVFQVVERDYTAIADKLAAVGPLADSLGLHRQERHLPARGAGRARWPRSNGVMLGGAGDGRPAIDTDEKLAEAILTLLRHHQRRARRAGLPHPRGAGRQEARRPRRGLGGEADHLRRHPGRAGAGHHLAGVVRARRPAGGATRRSPSTSSGSSRSTP